MQIDPSIIQEMANCIAERFDPQRIILFGSYARGDAHPMSDVDLLVVLDTTLPKPKRSAPMYSLLRHYPYSKDILVYTSAELDKYKDLPMSLAARALAEGITLYERQAPVH